MMEQVSLLQLVGQVSCRMSAHSLVGRVSALRFHAPLLRSVRATMKAIHWGALEAKAGCWRAKAAAAATTTWHQAHCCSCTAQALLMCCVCKELIACQHASRTCYMQAAGEGQISKCALDCRTSTKTAYLWAALKV